MMFDRHANLKYKFGNRHFWSEGYYVTTVGMNEKTIRKYIQDQEKADIMKDKLSVKEYEDPFKSTEKWWGNPFRDTWRVKCTVAWTKWKPAPWDAGFQQQRLIAARRATRFTGGGD